MLRRDFIKRCLACTGLAAILPLRTKKPSNRVPAMLSPGYCILPKGMKIPNRMVVGLLYKINCHSLTIEEVSRLRNVRT